MTRMRLASHFVNRISNLEATTPRYQRVQLSERIVSSHKLLVLAEKQLN